MTRLLLIHGLGATSAVWSSVVERLEWDGPVSTPDLPGHGLGPWTGDYTVGALAAAVSAACEDGEPVLAVGHSLGGGVALCLASQVFRPNVTGAIGLGIKVSWTDDDVANMAKVAARGQKPFATKDEAIDRFLRMAGLTGVVEPDHPSTENSVVEVDGQWFLAQDPATFAQHKLDMAGLMAAVKCPVILGAGDRDLMVSADDLATHVADPRMRIGTGHNVQVEDPDWVIELINELGGS